MLVRTGFENILVMWRECARGGDVLRARMWRSAIGWVETRGTLVWSIGSPLERDRMIRCFKAGIAAFFVFTASADVLAISCGSTTTDSRFLAVCGLAPRSRPANESWLPDGSGVYVQWTDPDNNPGSGSSRCNTSSTTTRTHRGTATRSRTYGTRTFRGARRLAPTVPVRRFASVLTKT